MSVDGVINECLSLSISRWPAAAVGSHTAVSAWFWLRLPSRADPAESWVNHTGMPGSAPAGASRAEDSGTAYEHHVLLINSEMQTFVCLVLRPRFVRVGQQPNLQPPDEYWTWGHQEVFKYKKNTMHIWWSSSSGVFVLVFLLTFCRLFTGVVHSLKPSAALLAAENFAFVGWLAAWLHDEIPQPKRRSLCSEVTPDTIYHTYEFQSKQQLVVFSSLYCWPTLKGI